MHDVANKYDCNKFIKYQHSIKAAIWNEDKAKWEIKVQRGDGAVFQDDVDVFINAGGVLKYDLSRPYYRFIWSDANFVTVTGSGLISKAFTTSKAS